MAVAVSMGQSERVAVYEVPDDQLAIGSTLGGPKAVCVIKASGALQQVYSTDLGVRLFGTVILRHYDAKTEMYLGPQKGGKFTIHPEHQEHHFTLAGDIAVREDVFVLSGEPGDGGRRPAGLRRRQCVRLRNEPGALVRPRRRLTDWRLFWVYLGVPLLGSALAAGLRRTGLLTHPMPSTGKLFHDSGYRSIFGHDMAPTTFPAKRT